MIEKIFPLYKVGKIGDVLFLKKRVFIFYKTHKIMHNGIEITPYFSDEIELRDYLVYNKYEYNITSQIRSMYAYILNSEEPVEKLLEENIKTFYTEKDIDELKLLKEII